MWQWDHEPSAVGLIGQTSLPPSTAMVCPTLWDGYWAMGCSCPPYHTMGRAGCHHPHQPICM